MRMEPCHVPERTRNSAREVQGSLLLLAAPGWKHDSLPAREVVMGVLALLGRLLHRTCSEVPSKAGPQCHGQDWHPELAQVTPCLEGIAALEMPTCFLAHPELLQPVWDPSDDVSGLPWVLIRNRGRSVPTHRQ